MLTWATLLGRRLPHPDPKVGLFGDGLNRLVYGPRALSRRRALRLSRVTGRIDDPEGMTPLLRGPTLQGETAMRAVIADALLVPGPVVASPGHPEVVRGLRARARAFGGVAPQAPIARAARVEADYPAVVVFFELEVTRSSRSA